MKEYLIDAPTLTTVWVTANSRQEAIDALYDVTSMMELRIEIGEDVPIQLVNFTISGEPEIVQVEPEEDGELDMEPSGSSEE